MVQEYINYFRSLAVSHKDLQHNVLSETGDGPVGSMRFTKISPDEVLEALRSAMGFPCMCLELYDTETQSQAVSEVKLLTKGAFMIIDNPDSNSFQAEQACFEKSEKIVYDLLRKIWKDHYFSDINECLAPFRFFDFDKITITPVSKIFGGQSGYRVVFDFELQKTFDITAPPEAGTFL